MIKLIKFLAEKIVIVETMLIILFLIGNYFSIEIPYLTNFINTALIYLTPISIVSLIIYIIFSILDHKFVKIILAIILSILIYIYFVKGA